MKLSCNPSEASRFLNLRTISCGLAATGHFNLPKPAVSTGKSRQPAYFPPVEIKAVSSRAVSQRVDRRKLSSIVESRNIIVSVDDISRITADMLSAYSAMRLAANKLCLLVNPVLARYKLFDRSGCLLYMSPPIVLSSGNESSLEVSLAFDSSNPAAEAYQLDASTYGIVIRSVADEEAAATVGSMTVEITPELDPVDYDGRASVVVTSNTSGKYTMKIAAPRDSAAMRTALVTAAMSDIDNAFTTVARIERPFDRDRREISLSSPIATCGKDYAAEKRTLMDLRKKTPPLLGDLWRVACPNGFHADHCVTNGQAVLYAGIKSERFEGYRIEDFAFETAAAPWCGYIKVTMADGTTVVTRSSGDSGAPVSLLPMLCYPSPDAVEMTVSILVNNTPFSLTVPLTRSLGSAWSFYVTDDLLPVVMSRHESSTYTEPTGSAAMTPLAGLIAGASSGDPLNIASTMAIGDCDITACVAADGNATGWENSRSRFLVFTTTGIHRVAIDKSGNIGSLSMIHHASVSSPEAVVITPGYGTLALASNGDLLQISGLRASVLDRIDGHCLRYDDVNRELHITESPDSRQSLVREMTSGYYSLRSLPPPTEGETVEIFLTVDLPLSSESRPRIKRINRVCHLKSIEIDMASPGIGRLTIDIHADYGRGGDNRLLLDRFIVKGGTIDSPLLLNINAGASRSISVTISGTVAPGTIIRQINEYH